MSPVGSAKCTKIYKNILEERDKINKGKKDDRRKNENVRKEKIRRENDCVDIAN